MLEVLDHMIRCLQRKIWCQSIFKFTFKEISEKLTWDTCHTPFQPWATCSNLVGSTLPQGPHRELEGAPRDMLASVLNADSVGAHFLGHESDAVGAVLTLHNLCGLHFATRAGHLGSHLLGAGFK